MMASVTIVEFLLARIAEDEERAKAAAEVPGGDVMLGALPTPLFDGMRIAFPKRVLAECEAKRRIVELSATWMDQGDRATGHDHATVMLKTQGITAETVLRTLALPYADHPDYRDEWRV